MYASSLATAERWALGRFSLRLFRKARTSKRGLRAQLRDGKFEQVADQDRMRAAHLGALACWEVHFLRRFVETLRAESPAGAAGAEESVTLRTFWRACLRFQLSCSFSGLRPI